MRNNAQPAVRRFLAPSGAFVLLLLGAALIGPAQTLLSTPGLAASSLSSPSPQVRFPRPPDTRVDPRAPKTLTGQVVDKDGRGLAQAVVHLKNQRTLEIRTHISDDEGNYRFNGLHTEIDFAVHAEHRGSASPTRTVSSFDDKKDVYLVLEIDPARQ